MPVQNLVEQRKVDSYYGTYGSRSAISYPFEYQQTRTRNWVNTPGFRTPASRASYVLSHGYLPTTAYTDDLQQVVNSRVLHLSGRLTASPPSATFEYRFVPLCNRVSCSTTDADASALRVATLSKLQGRMAGHGFSLPVTMAELPKSAQMIGNAAKALSNAISSVRRGKFRQAAMLLNLDYSSIRSRVGKSRTFDQNWLEYRYGWRLAVQDIYSGLKTAYDLLRLPVHTQRVGTFLTAEATPVVQALPNQVVTMPNGTQIALYTLNTRSERSLRVDAGYVFRIENAGLATGQMLGMLNPALVAWDLIPFTFVLDWVGNVGEALEGLTAFSGKQFLDGWIATSVETRKTFWWTDIRKSPSVYSLDPGAAFYTGPVIERRFTRSVLTAFVPTEIQLDLKPTFQRALDALALVRQAIRRR